MARRSAHAVLSIQRNNSVLKLSAFAVATAMASHQVRNLEYGEGLVNVANIAPHRLRE